LKLLQWLFGNWQLLVANGTATVSFAEFAAEAIHKLFNRAPTPAEVTNEMLEELRADWPGALPVPEKIFDPILFEN